MDIKEKVKYMLWDIMVSVVVSKVVLERRLKERMDKLRGLI
jgi:hypothetical protein